MHKSVSRAIDSFSSSAVMNWVEQGVNCLGQALLLAGVIVLHKAGLRELEL